MRSRKKSPGQFLNFRPAPKTTATSFFGAESTINFLLLKKTELSLLSKYVSKQYLDNTQDSGRVLSAYYVQDVKIIYTIKKKKLKELNIIGQVNNIFGKKYEPNGYTYNYIYGGEFSVNNYYFPMAGTNVMVGVSIKL